MSSPAARQQSSKLEAFGNFLWIVGVVASFALFMFLAVYHKFYAARAVVDEKELAVLESVRLEERQRAPGDWFQWRGPNRDGVSLETGLLTTWPAEGPKELWRKPAGPGYSSVAVSAGRIFSMLRDGENEAVVCWNADDGRELWRYAYRCDHTGVEWGSGPRSTPTVDGDHLYSVGATGILHCLKTRPATAKGESVWSIDLLKESGASVPQWGISFSPLVDGDVLYTIPGGPNGKSLMAFNKLTGKLLWSKLDDRGGYSSPVVATLAGQKQILFFTAQGLLGVTPDEGRLLWRYPWETSYDCNIATPIVLGDYVFISSGYGRGCAVVKIDRAADTFQAKRVYEHNKMCNHFSTCVLYDGHLYGFSDPSRLTCMDFRTGKIRWKDNGELGKGSLIVADGHLIIMGERGRLAIAEATHEEYREKAALQVSGNQTWSLPVLANGRLYYRDEEHLICFDVRK